MSFTQFIKPYPNGYIDSEAGDTPVTAEILNTNYDGFLLGLNEFLPELAGMVEANPSESATAGNLTKLKVGNSIYLVPSGGSGGSTVEWEQLQLTGTKIATITIDNVPIDVYAPSGGGSGDEVEWTQVLGSGTEIGTITINGSPTTVYAPTPIDVEANPSDSATAGDLTKLKVGSSIYSIPSGGSGGASDLSDLGDVSITNVQNGQIIKWNSTTLKWENSNESGGGSGHTILDDDGTALSQEDDLQFIGVYSEDDSTDEVTKVNIYREMTKSEFNLLSSDEKKGFIRTTDEPDIVSIVDGVFIDTTNVITSGTYSASSPLSYTATEDCVVVIYLIANNSHAYLYIDNVMVYDVFSNGTQVFAPMIMLKKGQTLSTVTSYSDTSGYTVYGIQSGTNPSIPDYSTTEHKTGRKWVDGKDIWECTTTTHSNLPYDESWVDSGIEITGDVISVYGSITRDNEPIPLGGSFNSSIYSKWIVRNNKLLIGVYGDSGEVYKINNITAQYTKSTS